MDRLIKDFKGDVLSMVSDILDEYSEHVSNWTCEDYSIKVNKFTSHLISAIFDNDEMDEEDRVDFCCPEGDGDYWVNYSSLIDCLAELIRVLIKNEGLKTNV